MFASFCRYIYIFLFLFFFFLRTDLETTLQKCEYKLCKWYGPGPAPRGGRGVTKNLHVNDKMSTFVAMYLIPRTTHFHGQLVEAIQQLSPNDACPVCMRSFITESKHKLDDFMSFVHEAVMSSYQSLYDDVDFWRACETDRGDGNYMHLFA